MFSPPPRPISRLGNYPKQLPGINRLQLTSIVEDQINQLNRTVNLAMILISADISPDWSGSFPLLDIFRCSSNWHPLSLNDASSLMRIYR